jgi:hypothetical protein
MVHNLPQIQWHNYHVEIEHNALLKMYVEEVSNWPRLAFEHHLTTKHPCIALNVISRFFSFTN